MIDGFRTVLVKHLFTIRIRSSEMCSLTKLGGGGFLHSFDKRNRLAEEIFTYRVTKDKKVFISFKGRHVTTLAGKASEKFLNKIHSADFQEAQLIMAKATGNFKHGNEKDHK